MHVQWFEHSSKIMLENISDPQELFFTDLCDTLDLRFVVGKAVVHYRRPNVQPAPLKPGEFFYK